MSFFVQNLPRCGNTPTIPTIWVLNDTPTSTWHVTERLGYVLWFQVAVDNSPLVQMLQSKEDLIDCMRTL